MRALRLAAALTGIIVIDTWRLGVAAALCVALGVVAALVALELLAIRRGE